MKSASLFQVNYDVIFDYIESLMCKDNYFLILITILANKSNFTYLGINVWSIANLTETLLGFIAA